MAKKYKGFKGSGYNTARISSSPSKKSRKMAAALCRALVMAHGIDAKY